MYIFSKIKHLLVCFEDILSIDNQVDTTSGRGCILVAFIQELSIVIFT